MNLQVVGELFYWRGPSPYHFVAVPDDGCAEIADLAAGVSYGWGMVPAAVRIGETGWTTSLFPRNGGYLVPVKDRIRRAEHLEDGDTVELRLTIGE